MTDAIEAHDLPRSTESEPAADNSPTPPPLIVLDGDADLVCVDDTCLPPDIGR